MDSFVHSFEATGAPTSTGRILILLVGMDPFGCKGVAKKVSDFLDQANSIQNWNFCKKPKKAAGRTPKKKTQTVRKKGKVIQYHKQLRIWMT